MENRYCSECGAPLSQGSTFCSKCVTRVISAPVVQQPAQQNARMQQPAQQPAQQNARIQQPAPQAMQQPMQQMPQQIRQPAPQVSQAGQASQPMQRPAQKKSNTKLIIAIIGVVVVVVAVIAVLVLTRIFGGGVLSASNHAETTGANSTASSSQTNAASPDSNAASSATESAPSSSSTTPGNKSLSTTSTPSANDFTWFTNNVSNWTFGALPSGAELLATSTELEGSWKGLQLIFDYDGTLLGKGFFTATFDTNETDAAFVMTIDWHYLEWTDGTREDLTTRADETKSGVYELPTFTMGVPGDQIQMYTYEKSGKQYAEGLWVVQSGEEVRVALTRP